MPNSTDYTHLTKIAFDTSLARQPSSGAEVDVLDRSGNFTVASVTNSGFEAAAQAVQAASATFTTFPSTKSFYKVTGTIAFNIQGIVAGVDGQLLEIYNATGQTMTVTASSGSATAVNQVLLMTTAATATTSKNGYASFRYSSNDSRWLLKYLTT